MRAKKSDAQEHGELQRGDIEKKSETISNTRGVYVTAIFQHFKLQIYANNISTSLTADTHQITFKYSKIKQCYYIVYKTH